MRIICLTEVNFNDKIRDSFQCLWSVGPSEVVWNVYLDQKIITLGTTMRFDMGVSFFGGFFFFHDVIRDVSCFEIFKYRVRKPICNLILKFGNFSGFFHHQDSMLSCNMGLWGFHMFIGKIFLEQPSMCKMSILAKNLKHVKYNLA